MQRITELLGKHPSVTGCEIGDGSVRVILGADVTDYSELPTLLIQNKIALKQFSEEELDLESAFMALTTGTSTRM
jgi:ABC-2 type transport system ATP-binding protein